MKLERFPFEKVRLQLATLRPTIEALLKCKTPMSPIVKEKIEQAEKIIYSIPFDLEPLAKSWYVKLADWWVEFATQQASFLLPREVELKMTTPPALPLSGLRPSKDSAVLSREHFDLPSKRTHHESNASSILKIRYLSLEDQNVPPSSLNDQPVSVHEPKASITEQVVDNIEWCSAPENSTVISDSHKESIPSSAVKNIETTVSEDMKTAPSGHIVPERKATFEQFPSDFDWCSASKRPMVSAGSAAINACPSNAVPAFVQKPTKTPWPTVNNNKGRQAQVPEVPAVSELKPEPTYEPVPVDFDWGSASADQIEPEPVRFGVKKRAHLPGQDCQWD